MSRGAWWATVHEITKSRTRLSNTHTHTHTHTHLNIFTYPSINICYCTEQSLGVKGKCIDCVSNYYARIGKPNVVPPSGLGNKHMKLPWRVRVSVVTFSTLSKTVV